MSWQFHTPRPIPLIMSVGAIVLLFGLGIWQLQRLAWKQDMLSTMEQSAQTAPAPQLPDTIEAIKEKRFYRFQLTGHYLSEPEFHLAARYYHSKLGYSVFNPFRLEDGRMVLVNRGWIPTERKDLEKHDAAPSGTQTILVQLRTSNERNYFTPANQADRNIWFGRDAQAMGADADLETLPITLDVIGDEKEGVYPIPTGGTIKPRNDHLSYAITWFGVGFAVIIITLLYHRKKPEENV